MNPSDDAVVDDKAPLWIYVNKIEKIAEGRSWRFEYKFCSNTYVGSYTRVVTHLLQEGIKGIKECLKVTPQQKINMKKLVNDCKERIKRAASTPVPLPSSSRKASASSLNYDMTYKFPDTRYVPPGYNALRTTLIQKERKNIEVHLQPLMDSWKQKGVIICTEGWSDPHRRPILNLIAANESGPMMLRAVNTQGEAKTAGALISAKFPTIFWTPCVVHTLNLALKNICAPVYNTRSNEEVYYACYWIKSISEDATWIKNFIMNYGMRLVMFTEHYDLKLLTIASTSPKWDDYKDDGVERASAIKKKILDEMFWDEIDYALSFTLPIYNVIREADTDKLSLHLVYEWWESMIQTVKKVIFRKERKELEDDSVFWNDVQSILTSRWSKSNTPLHCMAHSLNPNLEDFGSVDAIHDRFILEPLRWGAVHGSSAPKLQALVFKLLGQPSSSSCCERNWSTYKFIHSTTRNKIMPQRAEDLVFVHTNLRLLSRMSSAYKEGPNKMWDVGGGQFDSLDDLNIGRLEFEDLSLDEPELEAVVFDGEDENE
uniref:DUF659 domain-containing protein n=1 Tax=Brassica oleracea var. oleracea TaxID=109376 RepID=A0A0D3CVV7_BRAOL